MILYDMLILIDNINIYVHILSIYFISIYCYYYVFY